MLRPLLLCLTLAAVALAGCSGSDSPKPKTVEPGEELEPTDTTGIIRGVAVDATIRPLEGVTILASSGAAQKQMRTDASGFFGADGLEPGTWFLSASKLGYDAVQQSVEVVAGVDDPPIVKVLLQENPALRPYSETYVWHGFLQCSAGVPEVGSLNPCFVMPESSNVWEQNLTATPKVVQAEMLWKPATAVGTSFLLSAFVPTDDVDDLDGVDDFAEAQGGSPLVLRVDGELLSEKAVPAEQPLALRVFPGTDQPTVFAQQAFDVYITVFYGYEPPEGWTFAADGPFMPNDA